MSGDILQTTSHLEHIFSIFPKIWPAASSFVDSTYWDPKQGGLRWYINIFNIGQGVCEFNKNDGYLVDETPTHPAIVFCSIGIYVQCVEK